MGAFNRTAPGINGGLECRRIPEVAIDGLAAVELKRSVRGSSMPAPPMVDGYVLSITFGTQFHANRAQYQKALEDAETLLREHIYGDIRRELYELRMRLYGGDRHGAMAQIDKIEDIMRGKP